MKKYFRWVCGLVVKVVLLVRWCWKLVFNVGFFVSMLCVSCFSMCGLLYFFGLKIVLR